MKVKRLKRGTWEQDGRLLKGFATWPAITYATSLEPTAILEGTEFSNQTIKATVKYLKSLFPKEPFTSNKVAVYMRLISKNQHIHTFEVDQRMAEAGDRAQPERTKAHYEDAAMLRSMAISLI